MQTAPWRAMYPCGWNAVAVCLKPPKSLRVDVENIDAADGTRRHSPQAIRELCLPNRDLSRVSGCGLKSTSDEGALVRAARKSRQLFERQAHVSRLEVLTWRVEIGSGAPSCPELVMPMTLAISVWFHPSVIPSRSAILFLECNHIYRVPKTTQVLEQFNH